MSGIERINRSRRGRKMSAAIAVICITVGASMTGIAQTDSRAMCSLGKKVTRDTHGHCCWPGQNWSRLSLECVGPAQCPPNFTPTDTGTDCVRDPCAGGRIDVAGRCCWPGQSWSESENRCDGTPICPAGHEVVHDQCVPRTSGIQNAKLDYIPVKEDDYIYVEKGVFSRGSQRREPGRYTNETAHTVALTRDILVKKTEVTQREWLGLVPANPSLFQGCGLQCPVERINWYEVLEWLNRQSRAEGLTPCYRFEKCTGTLGGGCKKAGQNPRTCDGDFVCTNVSFVGLQCSGFRLPTEAEWEYVARANTNTATYAGNITAMPARDAFVLDPIAWYSRNAQVDYTSGQSCSVRLQSVSSGPQCGTHPVGRKTPSNWGHFDMLGNVMEWVWDGFGHYPRRSAVDPIQHYGLDRIVRGGSWASNSRFLRAALRSRMSPKGRNAEIGFRAVRTVVQRDHKPELTPPTDESFDSPIPIDTSRPRPLSKPSGHILKVERGLIPPQSNDSEKTKGRGKKVESEPKKSIENASPSAPSAKPSNAPIRLKLATDPDSD